MQTLTKMGGAIVGVVFGGTIGGLIGWVLGDFGGRSDPENVWFLSVITGAAVGIAIAIAIIIRHAKRLGWGLSLIIGGASGIATATAVILFVAWQRHP